MLAGAWRRSRGTDPESSSPLSARKTSARTYDNFCFLASERRGGRERTEGGPAALLFSHLLHFLRPGAALRPLLHRPPPRHHPHRASRGTHPLQPRARLVKRPAARVRPCAAQSPMAALGEDAQAGLLPGEDVGGPALAEEAATISAADIQVRAERVH